jgi:hypothetical protein
MTKHRRSNVPRPSMIRGPWVAHPVAMIRVLLGLGLAARRILDVLEIEHCCHGRRDNGRLVCTYSNFEQGGVRRGSICGALRELVAVGLIEITRLGRRSYADLRLPSLYRLTFEPTYVDGKRVEPTHEWKKQKAGDHSTTGASSGSNTGSAQKPVANRSLREGKSQWRFNHSFLESRVEGGGGAADSFSPIASPPAPAQEGTGPSASSPPSDDDQLPSIASLSSGRLD